MDESRICALHDTAAVYLYRFAPIDNYIALEKWGIF